MKYRIWRTIVLGNCIAISAVLFLATSTFPFDVTAQQLKVVKVTVLLFSGRPDPVFELTDVDQMRRLSALLKEAPREEKKTAESVIPSTLGYKGILVENMGGSADLPFRMAVYRGSIEVGTDRKEFFADAGGRMESFLLQQAIDRGVIPEPVMRRMKEQGLPR
jgi:hypothetical protein